MPDFIRVGTGSSLANPRIDSVDVLITGRLLRVPQILTSGTSINHPVGTKFLFIRGTGGGAAGGGTDAIAGSIGANGGAGTYGERTFVAPALTSTYTVGAAGLGVSGAAGADGTASTFTNGATTVTLPGGIGGGFLTGGTTVAIASGGAGGAAATNADISVPGQTGGDAIRMAAATVPCMHSGAAGSNPLGMGGQGNATATTAAAANAARGFGAGGGGRLSGTSTTATTGADGTPGVWIVEEYT